MAETGDGLGFFASSAAAGLITEGPWEPGGSSASLLRFGFEIYPELEPEAVLALTILYSRDLGF